MDYQIIKNESLKLEASAAVWNQQKRNIMNHETKIKLGVAFVCAAVGYAAAPKVLNGVLKLTRVAQTVCDWAVRKTL